MHHSSTPDPEIQEKLRKLGIGATGRFPEGQLNDSDEGEIAFAVRVENAKVVIDFGKPVIWLGMNANQARDLGNLLIQKATKAKLAQRARDHSDG